MFLTALAADNLKNALYTFIEAGGGYLIDLRSSFLVILNTPANLVVLFIHKVSLAERKVLI